MFRATNKRSISSIGSLVLIRQHQQKIQKHDEPDLMFLHRNKQGQYDTLKQDLLKHTKHSESAFPNNPYFLQISGTMVTPSSITRYEYTFGDNGPI